MMLRGMLCALLVSPLVLAQVPQYKLQVTGEKVISEPSGSIILPVKCDVEGNIYVRTGTGKGLRAFTRRVLRISPDGSSKVLTLDSNPDLKELDAYDFTVDTNGDVFFTAAGPASVYVIDFDKDGKYKTKTKLDHVFQPKHVAILDKGAFLIAGIDLPTKVNPAPRAFTAIFDSSGKTTKNVRLPPSKVSNKPDQSDDPEAAHDELMFGTALTGEDGNAYILRHTSPALIYVVTPSGEIVRTLKVSPPLQGMLPDSMHLSKGKILITFADDRQAMFKLVQTESGEEIAEYTTTPEIGGAVGCYDGREITFLTNKDRHLAVTKTAP